MRVIAFLGTPARFQLTPNEVGQVDLITYRVLSGVMQIRHETENRVDDAKALGGLKTDFGFTAQTWGMFSSVMVILPSPAGDSTEKVNREMARLGAVIELGRAFLVESLAGTDLLEREARLMRELLIAPMDLGAPSPLREKALSLIEWEHTNPCMTIESMAAELNVSRRHLYRSFQGSGSTVGEMLQQRRIETAVEWLTTSTTATVSEIARESGFGSSDQFRRTFKRVYGVAPNEFRVANQTGDVLGSPSRSLE